MGTSLHASRTFPKKTFIPAIIIACAGLLPFWGCPPPQNPSVEPAQLPLIVGMEYALPGMAPDLIETRLPGVKFMPDVIAWEKMQPTESASINFGFLDRMVKEYQGAGYQECMIALKSNSPWASIAPASPLPQANFAPKPEYMDAYAAWLSAVVERYDADGNEDMPGLEHPIRYYEIGVEFSSYEPEPVQDYLGMLAQAYPAIHAAYPQAIVTHAAFLPSTAFANNPTPEQYETAFAAVSPRIMYHSLAEMRVILDRPDLFDAVNVHLASLEIEPATAWLRYEMEQRAYDKPIVISDTAPNPLIGWGPADTCTDAIERMGLVIAPAAETDRCRLADFFCLLLTNDANTLEWTRGFIAEDMTKLVVRAAACQVAFVNTSFMEDLYPLNQPMFHAAAGISAWGGMAETSWNFFTQEHKVTRRLPLFYALQQLTGHLDGYNTVDRVETEDPEVYFYHVSTAATPPKPECWIAWYEPNFLVLPGDATPHTSLTFSHAGTQLTEEPLITKLDQTAPTKNTIDTPEGTATLTLSPTPVFLATAQ